MAATVKMLAIAAAVALLPFAVAAQGGPSFDCAKASNAVEHAVCKDADLAKADRELSQLYAALFARLTGPAKESLQKAQLAWVVNRNRGCTGDDADAMSICLKRRYDQRIADLKASARGPYPFVEAQWIEKKGKVGKVGYAINVSYPHFAGTSANFSAVNKAYADAAASGAKEATPTAEAGADVEQQWSAEGGYALYRPGPDAITVQASFYSYTGGAHGYGSVTCALVDLRSGRFVPPEAVFVAGDEWHKRILTIATSNLKWQFEANPGFDDALQPTKLGKMLREGDRFCWQEAHLEIYFNQYDVGPYAAGPYSVNISYDSIRPLLRAGGPIK
jgi:uncharacterized protein